MSCAQRKLSPSVAWSWFQTLSFSPPFSQSLSHAPSHPFSLYLTLPSFYQNTHTHTLSNITYICLPERHGVMDNAVACHAGGPGLIPAMSKWFFPLGHKVVGKNGASHDNWCDLASPCSFKYIIIILATPPKRRNLG